MKPLLLAIGCLIMMVTNAQFVNSPMPFKQSDFKSIKAGGYTRCSVYEVSGDEKIFVKYAEYGFAGMVASMSERGTNAEGDSINTSSIYYKFDDKGRLVHETTEGSEGDDDSYPTAYYYDAKGKLVRKIEAHIDPPTYNYKYDATGKLKEIVVTLRLAVFNDSTNEMGKANDVPWDKYLVKCNAAGQVIEKTEYNLRSEDKAPVAKYAWQYNAAGNIIKYTYKSLIGEDLYIIDYTYNQGGLLIKSKETKTDEPDKILVYEYCKSCKQNWK